MISSDFILRSNSLRTQNFFTPWYVRVHIFSENIAYVLNEWSLVDVVKKHLPTGSSALSLSLSLCLCLCHCLCLCLSQKRRRRKHDIWQACILHLQWNVHWNNVVTWRLITDLRFLNIFSLCWSFWNISNIWTSICNFSQYIPCNVPKNAEFSGMKNKTFLLFLDPRI